MNENQAILITGASSGIGNACAKFFALNGFQVFAGVRNQTDFDILNKYDDNIYPVIIDVTDNDSICSAYEFIYSNLKCQKFSLINNAGIAVASPLECINIDRLKEQFDVNVIGQMRLIQTFLPILRCNNGKIINISSVFGSFSLPYTSPYCASKAAFDSLSNALRLELKKWNIDVVLVKPGIVNTKIWEKSSGNSQKEFNDLDDKQKKFYNEEFNILTTLSAKFAQYGCSVEKIVNLIFKIVISSKTKPVYFIGNDSNIMNLIRKTPQQFVDAIILFFVRIGIKLFKNKLNNTKNN